MEIKYEYILCRYGELVLKGKNRRDFINALLRNTKAALADFKNLSYEARHDGLYIHLNGEDFFKIKPLLEKVFGFVHFSGAIACDLDIEKIAKTALYLAQNAKAKTFKVVAKRQDKRFSLNSDAINRQVAGVILRNTDLKVDVHDPDLKLYITILSDKAYIMDEKIPGAQGFPVGINGRALCFLSGGIDSPISAYLTMKKGLRVEFIHFASMPYTSKQALDKVKELAKILSVYEEEAILHIVPFTDLQLAIYEHADESYAITIMRRMMYRIGDRLAKKRHITLITNGESVGQVASQTIESLSVISSVASSLVIRPLAMMDKSEIMVLARKIGTYDTSILPYDDCCTIFEPKNPVTKPKLDKCEYYESKFDYETLIEDCLNKIETIKITNKEKDDDIF